MISDSRQIHWFSLIDCCESPFLICLKNRNRAQIPLLFDSHPLIILVSHLRWDEQVIWSDVVCTLPVTWNPPPWPCTCQHLLSCSCVGLIDLPFHLLRFHQHGLGPLLIVPSFHRSTWITELFSFWMDQYNSWISLSLLLDLKTCGWLRQACGMCDSLPCCSANLLVCCEAFWRNEHLLECTQLNVELGLMINSSKLWQSHELWLKTQTPLSHQPSINYWVKVA